MRCGKQQAAGLEQLRALILTQHVSAADFVLHHEQSYWWLKEQLERLIILFTNSSILSHKVCPFKK